MKLFSGSKNSNVLLITALVAALLFALYYYLVLPKKEEVEQVQNSMNTLQAEISTVQQQMAPIETPDAENANTFELRKKVPKSREVDELLLNIEEIEYVAGTRVTSISFNNYDSLVSESGIGTNQEGETPEEEQEIEDLVGEEAQENPEQTEVTEAPVSSISKELLPPELKLITFSLNVEGPTYQSIEEFIKEIESLERVMHVDTINYSLPGEESVFSEEDEILTASIQVTTFYYEGEN